MANYIPLKGYDVLLSALEQMSHRDVELHVAGFDTDSDALRHQVAMLAPSAHVVQHGRMNREQVRELLWQCDALVLASRSEVQPLAVLEAMSTGIPVVATEVVPENERIEGATWIVPVDDIPALAQAMDEVIACEAPDGEALSQKVTDIASPTLVARKLEEVFSSL
jgi:glycosyltransferase involved in cell wall biosynthesis